MQQAADAGGMPVSVIRKNKPPDAITDTKIIEKDVRAWRKRLSAAVNGQLSTPLDWDEGMKPPYFTDKPGWDGYGAAVLLAAYHELGRELPATLSDEWPSDPAIEEAKALRTSRQIFEPEWCLPMNDDVSFVCPILTGKQLQVGSSIQLRDQLRALNAATFAGSPADLTSWRREGPPERLGSDFRRTARFGLAVLIELSASASEHRLPMLMDY